MQGVFKKHVRPMSKKLDSEPLSISDSKELYDAAKNCLRAEVDGRLLLVKGTKFGTTTSGMITALDGHNWRIKNVIVVLNLVMI
ncbi:MAG: hypothetical protein ACJAVV_003128 [Alphaproteobacteria bacterium]|jgi:hypothetical protein